MKMRAPRMYGWNEPLRLKEVDVPDTGTDGVLVKVAATGMCRSDVQLIEGYRDLVRRADGPHDRPPARAVIVFD